MKKPKVAWNKGLKGAYSPEYRAKISEALRNRVRRPDTTSKWLEKMKDYKHSEETKAKISNAHKNSSKMLAYHENRKGVKRDPDIGKKISESKKGMEATFKGSDHPNWKGGISFTKAYKTVYSERRRARKKLALGKFTHGEWETLKKQYAHTCPCCKRPEPVIILTIDHIIPISKGGSNFIENIQPLCRSCNSKKHNKVIKYEI